MKTVVLCPGQGSQFVGMGKELAESSAAARETFQEANEALGFDLQTLLFEGPEDELTQTKNTQPAILAHTIAAYRDAQERGLVATAAAGHSLGEYSAYVIAKSLSFEDALRLVRIRGELMYDAGLSRPGTMAAILGLDASAVEEICASVSDGVVCPANINSPAQVVISGDPSAVEAAMKVASDKGAKRVVPLNVSGAFHSPLMEPAANGLRDALREVEVQTAAIPVVANATAQVVQEPDAIRESLAQQVLSPVRWNASVVQLAKDPGGPFMEVGPGKVLRGLMRAIDRSLEVKTLADLDA
ncbi:MAG: ACP S-malonyltransferase [Candidatus Eisenbacteria bacterium]|uniref:Malonyl CoA-acyl carrier protein transacylase n=1 Tax=Eiseniibacteriota bacterium TaxID=2212470 RepID=A0A7Y2E9Q3_UNCEI|nr:ACP S-malonyltransferase [Candidatus Eisenbacteria bacterium]